MKYLKNKDYKNWVVKILPEKAIAVWETDINIYQNHSHFLESEDYEEATSDEFEQAFEKAILELKILAQ